MGNLFASLPVPLANGAGASVDTSGYGKPKTVVYTGDIEGAVEVQVSADNANFVTAHTFTGPGKVSLSVAAMWMRAFVSNYVRGASATMEIGGNDDGATTANLPVPAGNGAGASVDVSALGTFNTFLCVGAFTGGLEVEVSQDNVSWQSCLSFTGRRAISKLVTAQFMRVRRSNVQATPGTPIVDVVATVDDAPAGAPSPPTGAAGGDLSSSYPNPTVVAVQETGDPARLAFGAIADGEVVVRSGATLVGTTLAPTYERPDTSGAPQTVLLPGAPALNQAVIVIDFAGNAAANNLTVDGNGNTINGDATQVIVVDYGSITCVYNGTEWNIT